MHRTSRWLLAVGITLFVVASWYPFQLDVPRWTSNGLKVLEDGTWRLRAPSIASTDGPPDWMHDAKEAGQLQVRLVARTHQTDQDGPARLLSLSQDIREQNLMIGQRQDDLVVRIRTAPGERAGVTVDDVFTGGAWRSIELTIRDGEASLVVDGRSVAETILQPFPGWATDHRLTLGNERAGGSRPWEGEIREAKVQVADREVDLLSETDWIVPSRVWMLPDRLHFLNERSIAARSGVSFLHFAAALTVGLIAVWARRQPKLLRTAAWWTLFVLVLNAGKFLIAGRHPSLLTTALQSCGGVLGMRLAVWSGSSHPRVRRREASPTHARVRSSEREGAGG